MALVFDVTNGITSSVDDPIILTISPVGTPRAVVVTICHGVTATDKVVGVTYGGVAMTRVQTNSDTVTEPGRTYLYFLGASIPTGLQNVNVDIDATGTSMRVVGATWTAAADTEVVDFDGLNQNQTNPNNVLQHLGRDCIDVAVDYTGTAAPGTVGANCTMLSTFDFTAFGTSSERSTASGTADFTISITHAADDCAFSCMAFAEVVAAVVLPPPPTIVTQAVERSYTW